MEQLREGGGHFDTWLSWAPPNALRDQWPQLIRLLKTLASRTEEDDAGVASDINAVRIFYTPLLESKYDNVQARTNDLKQLEVIASRYRSRTEFLSEMTLDPPRPPRNCPPTRCSMRIT